MIKPRKRAPLPTRQQILDFIKESPTPVGKREIARAFRIAADDRPALRELLQGLTGDKDIRRSPSRRYAVRDGLPETAVVAIVGTDEDGELLARPLAWNGEAPPPRILMAPYRAGQIALGVGDHVLARLRRLRPGLYEGRALKRLAAGPARVLGVLERNGDGPGRLRPTDRRQKAEFVVAAADMADAKPGELVLAEVLPGRPHGLRPARVVERLGDMGNPRTISLVAIHAHDIPHEFPEEALDQADGAGPAPLDGREDLRTVPLVTIDGADARDFDDAVWAGPDGDGWHILVAIADVAWYVRPGDALDSEARNRGNSVYFPDRVVPMLPEALSNGWCSLRPGEDRPCLAAHIWIDREGNKTRHRFVRGLMRSAARLTYEQVQAAFDGRPDETIQTLPEGLLASLQGAWRALFAERRRRGVLELEIPERKVVLDDMGRIEQIVPRPNLESHRLIEDFMIAANVAAAEQIEAVGRPCMYRVHDLPSAEKLEGLRDFLSSIGLSLSPGQVIRPERFNAILAKAREMPEAALVNEIILRAQAQAAYSPDNIGHFGLGLPRYAHFTSPIRRYADLLVHRALIGGLGLGDGAAPGEGGGDFAETALHISATERRAAAAERDAIDRFTALFLKDRVGARFGARVNGVTRFGLFVTLDETGADGLVPVSTLPADYYIHDERGHCLKGRRYGAVFTLGDAIEVILAEADPLTGGLVFTLSGSGSRPAADGARGTSRLAGRRRSGKRAPRRS